MPSRDFTSEDLFSSRMMSMQSSTHSSQMKTVGPAISFLTSCWLLPQNEQYKVFLESVLPTLLIPFSVSLVPIPDQADRSKQRPSKYRSLRHPAAGPALPDRSDQRSKF